MLTEKELKNLFEQAIKTIIEEIQNDISEPLPKNLCFSVENDPSKKRYHSIDQIIHFFYKDGAFPYLVDIAVRGIDNNEYTVIWFRVSGYHFVQDLVDTWNGTGPFNGIGLMLPGPIWRRPRPLSLSDLREAGQWQKPK